MSDASEAMEESVVNYCVAIGRDPLLVQGAGGNASWKEGETLWVKASGTWLADAAETNIFVPVAMPHLRAAFKQGDFSITPKLSGESSLRPSIETLLHALMPHRVVIHLHPIEILAHLVRDGCEDDLRLLIDPSIRWTIADYHKPGSALAAAVSFALTQAPHIDVIFLKNHGVVIGGDCISDVKRTLDTLIANLRTAPLPVNSASVQSQPSQSRSHYVSIKNSDIHQLALNERLFDRLGSDWALYPDHVVFLGARAYTYDTWADFEKKNKENTGTPELIFIRNVGVFANSDFNNAKQAQLQCYYDVLARQTPSRRLNALSADEIADLLNWDAEKYRQLTAK